MERFWSKVEIADVHSCWEWTAYRNPDGYGKFHVTGEGPVSAHRVVYEMVRGAIPSELEIDHLCSNRGCVNPFHLEPVTHAVNIQRGAACTGYCKNGHKRTQENCYKDGHCRICRRAYLKRKKLNNVGRMGN